MNSHLQSPSHGLSCSQWGRGGGTPQQGKTRSGVRMLSTQPASLIYSYLLSLGGTSIRWHKAAPGSKTRPKVRQPPLAFGGFPYFQVTHPTPKKALERLRPSAAASVAAPRPPPRFRVPGRRAAPPGPGEDLQGPNPCGHGSKSKSVSPQ